MYQPEQPIFDTQPISNIKVSLKIDDVPKTWWQTMYFALQITLVDFTPFIWAGSFVFLAGLPESVIPVMIAACFIAMGVGTLIQTTIGNRLPIVQGPSASLVAAMGSVTAVYGMPAMWGAVIIGGLLEFLVGAGRLMSKIRALLPPVVIGAVVASVGFVAARLAIMWTFSNTQPLYMGMAIVAFLLALFFKFRCTGLLSHGFILITVVIVGIIGGSLFGVFNWAGVANAKWFALPRLFPFRNFEGVGNGRAIAIVGAAIIGGLSGYIGSMFESIGDYAATCAASDEVFRVKHIDRGIMAEGLSCMASGVIGALPVTSYTQNVGIIAATGIASRRVTQVAALLFLLYGLCPKLAMILASIPRPVIGSVFLITASMIMFAGVDLISSSKRTERNTLVAGTTLGVSVMLPFFVTTGGKAWAATLPPFINMVVGSNIFLAVLFGVALNLLLNVVFKEKDGA